MEQALAELVDLAHSRIDYDDDSFEGGYSYMRGRGVTDEQIRKYKLGIGPSVIWAPQDLRETPDGDAKFLTKWEVMSPPCPLKQMEC